MYTRNEVNKIRTRLKIFVLFGDCFQLLRHKLIQTKTKKSVFNLYYTHLIQYPSDTIALIAKLSRLHISDLTFIYFL